MNRDEIQGLRHAVEIIGDLEARTVGTGSMRELMVIAYKNSQAAILGAIARAEAALPKESEGT